MALSHMGVGRTLLPEGTPLSAVIRPVTNDYVSTGENLAPGKRFFGRNATPSR